MDKTIIVPSQSTSYNLIKTILSMSFGEYFVITSHLALFSFCLFVFSRFFFMYIQTVNNMCDMQYDGWKPSCLFLWRSMDTCYPK